MFVQTVARFVYVTYQGQLVAVSPVVDAVDHSNDELKSSEDEEQVLSAFSSVYPKDEYDIVRVSLLCNQDNMMQDVKAYFKRHGIVSLF